MNDLNETAAQQIGTNRSLVLLMLSCFLLLLPVLGTANPTNTDLASAQGSINSGDFASALEPLKKVVQSCIERHDSAGEIAASLKLANAYEALGQSRLAQQTLEAVKPLSHSLGDKRSEALIQSGIGSLLMLSTDTDDADGCLAKGVALAKASGDAHTMAVTLNNQANLHVYEKKFDLATGEYEQAYDLAEKSRDASLGLKVASNLASACLNSGDAEGGEKWAGSVVESAAKMPDSHAKATAFVAAGRSFQQLFTMGGATQDALRLKAYKALALGADVAGKINDPRTLSYALGYEAQLYEIEKKFSDALDLTHQALFWAQQSKAPDIIFRWDGQAGRLLTELNQPDDAILAYRSAISTLEPIRHDLSLHYGNGNFKSSFREVAGSIFFSLADLLLQRADKAKDDAEEQSILISARDVIEDLKSAELEDYFQDDCANLLRSKITKVESISPTAAVLYIIPLANRTEVLVFLPSGKVERFKSSATADDIEKTATLFRYNLEKRSTDEYLEQGSQLYNWLIRPLEETLSTAKIDTLVFVPDGALLTIPMSALFDGNDFLVQKFAIATTPGMTLLAPKPLVAQQSAMIIDGLSEAVQGFAPLTHVPDEVHELQDIYKGPAYMNSAFVKPTVNSEFATDNYSIVHIASHGHFDSDAKKTFVLTFDGTLNLDEIEQMIRPSQIRDKPVELLTLSACQTAAGDDRAALGLAGIAVKSGARCAFATLWFVDDAASTQVVGDFYKNLHDVPGISKAKALQNAQIKLLQDPRFGHPCYWAPYLIIGNWL